MGRGKSKNKVQGLGDVIKKVTEFVGVQPCEACEERRQRWNTLFPNRLKPRELTENELIEYKLFQENRTLRLDNSQRKFLCKIYSDVFQVPYFEPCPTCSAEPYLKMIQRMDQLIETY